MLFQNRSISKNVLLILKPSQILQINVWEARKIGGYDKIVEIDKAKFGRRFLLHKEVGQQ